MKVEEYDDTVEIALLHSMAKNAVVLGKVASRWEKPGLFSNPFVNVIAQKCLSYHRRYGKAPKNNLPALMVEWAEGRADTETVKMVDQVLGRVVAYGESNGKAVNVDHVVDRLARQFNKVKIARHVQELEADLGSGRVDEAAARIASFRRVDMAGDALVDPILDQAEIDQTFSEEDSELLVRYDRGLQHVFQNAMERDSLTAFLAASKATKSLWLLDVAVRAMLGRRRSALVIVGDMSRRQVKRRLYAHLLRHPTINPMGDWPYVVRWPKSIKPPPGEGDAVALVDHERLEFQKLMSPKKASRLLKEFMDTQVRSLDSFFKLACFPPLGTSVVGIRTLLEEHDAAGWVADVVVIDYADNLAPVDRKLDKLDQTNETWQLLRSLSMTRHCLVVTATQSNRPGFRKELLDREDVCGDRRKLDHVTAMFGINMSTDEKDAGVSRINVINRREGDFNSRRPAYVAGCLALANPAIVSVFPRKDG